MIHLTEADTLRNDPAYSISDRTDTAVVTGAIDAPVAARCTSYGGTTTDSDRRGEYTAHLTTHTHHQRFRRGSV
jgi:hypothetical protein